jgi:hypothetical protein
MTGSERYGVGLLKALSIDPSKATVDDVMSALRKVDNPRVYAFRCIVRQAKTSQLISWAVDPSPVLDIMVIDVSGGIDEIVALSAGAAAVADELDRRIPVPS